MCAAACYSRQLSPGVQGFFALTDLPRRQILSPGLRHCWFSSRGSVAPAGISVFHLGLSCPVPRGLANELLLMVYQLPKSLSVCELPCNLKCCAVFIRSLLLGEAEAFTSSGQHYSIVKCLFYM